MVLFGFIVLSIGVYLGLREVAKAIQESNHSWKNHPIMMPGGSDPEIKKFSKKTIENIFNSNPPLHKMAQVIKKEEPVDNFLKEVNRNGN